jgi:hypothetical protein
MPDVVHSSHRGSRDIEHIGSGHDDVELELLRRRRGSRWRQVRASWTWVWMRGRRAGEHVITAAANPPPTDLRQVIEAINSSR